MSTKKETRKQFRPKLFVTDIHQAEDRDPNYVYKQVITDFRHDPRRRQRYMDAGWEVVEDSGSIDDRDFTPNSKKEKLRPQPCITKTMCGHTQILMRIPLAQWEENQQIKKRAREDYQFKLAQQNGDTLVNEGNSTKTIGRELSE